MAGFEDVRQCWSRKLGIKLKRNTSVKDPDMALNDSECHRLLKRCLPLMLVQGTFSTWISYILMTNVVKMFVTDHELL